MMSIGWATDPIRLIRARYAPSYLMMNLLFYGCIGLGMLIAVEWPAAQNALAQSRRKDLQRPEWSVVVNAYAGRHLVRAAAITFAVNFLLGTFIELSLTSLIIPFIGIALGMFRAVLWGVFFAPGPHGGFHALATHWPVLLVEGQGYVLGMLSVWIQGNALMKPAAVGAVGHRQGYQRGLFQAVRIYPLIALVLAVSAVYEATEVILVSRR